MASEAEGTSREREAADVRLWLRADDGLARRRAKTAETILRHVVAGDLKAVAYLMQNRRDLLEGVDVRWSALRESKRARRGIEVGAEPMRRPGYAKTERVSVEAIAAGPGRVLLRSRVGAEARAVWLATPLP